MEDEYIEEGYQLITTYIKEQDLKVACFEAKLNRFYNEYQNKEYLTVEDEKKYLRLEHYFFTNILKESDKSEDIESLELLKILTKE